MSTKCIQLHLERLLSYVDPYWDWINCHMVSYFTNNHWENYVPIELQQEFDDCLTARRFIEKVALQTASTPTSCIGTVNCHTEFKAFANFYQQTQRHCLSKLPNNIVLTLREWQELCGIEEAIKPVNAKEFLSAKKRHEVELSTQLIHNMLHSASANDVYIVDAGDGKGYLSSRLALEYGYKVLGIDSNKANAINALERNRKLQRYWKSLKMQAATKPSGIGISNDKRDTTLQQSLNSQDCGTQAYDGQEKNECSHYKTTSHFITNELDFCKILKQHFPEFKQQAICITGLHTCGNLATTCLQAFHSHSLCKYLFNIGCCYHLLNITENKSSAIFMASNNNDKNYMTSATDYGFPMSEYLQRREFKLERNARMLATQSLDRLLAGKMLPNPTLYYRALLEVLITESCNECNLNEPIREIQIGKLRSYQNFTEYIEKCKEKFPFLQIAAESVTTVEQRYAEQRPYLELFYILRMQFAPVIEAIILLDRLLYLKELNYNKSCLISLFDPIISPRSYAIVAKK